MFINDPAPPPFIKSFIQISQQIGSFFELFIA